MKLTDILREIEGEEDGMNQLKVNYDLAVQPKNIDDALKAMDDTKNYGIYAQNMRDPKTIEKIFGPSNPGKKSVAAQSNWDSLSPEAKLLKIEEIKERLEFAQGETVNIGNAIFSKVKNALDKNKEYLKWSEENGDNPEKYLATLNGKQASDVGIFGSRGSAYYPQRTPDNLEKYAGKLEQDIHYIVKDGKIIFPSTLENPYKTKPYLSKVLKTIMDNSGVKYELVDVEQDGGEAPMTKEKTPQPTSTTTILTLTLDPDKIKGKKPELNNIVKLLKNTYDKNFDYNEDTNVIKIANIKPERRADVRNQFSKFLKQQSPIKEDFDFERYQMLRRAGIIK